VTVFALALIAFWFYKTKETQLKVILALVSGAATGNLVDRLAYGSVVDFIKLSFYPPVFNIADSVLTICIVWLAVYFTVKENKPKRKK
jgi:signal peptidase II